MGKRKKEYDIDELERDIKQVKQGLYFVLSNLAERKLANLLEQESKVKKARQMYDSALIRTDDVDVVLHLKDRYEQIAECYDNRTKEYNKLNKLIIELRNEYDKH